MIGQGRIHVLPLNISFPLNVQYHIRWLAKFYPHLTVYPVKTKHFSRLNILFTQPPDIYLQGKHLHNFSLPFGTSLSEYKQLYQGWCTYGSSHILIPNFHTSKMSSQIVLSFQQILHLHEKLTHGHFTYILSMNHFSPFPA